MKDLWLAAIEIVFQQASSAPEIGGEPTLFLISEVPDFQHASADSDHYAESIHKAANPAKN